MTSPKTNENSNTKKQLHLLHFFKLRNTFHEQSEIHNHVHIHHVYSIQRKVRTTIHQPLCLNEKYENAYNCIS